jgi:hypothetical protein
MIAQAIRAILLASATAATFAGRRSIIRDTQVQRLAVERLLIGVGPALAQDAGSRLQ